MISADLATGKWAFVVLVGVSGMLAHWTFLAWTVLALACWIGQLEAARRERAWKRGEL